MFLDQIVRRYSLQGTITVGGTLLYQASQSRSAIITGIIFTNPTNAYEIYLSKFSSSQNLTQDVYQLTGLAIGDVITDNFNYPMEPNDSLTADTNVAGTTYLINIIEYA